MTDHQPLVTLVKLKEPFGRLGRLLQYLAGVDFKMSYIPGRQNYLTDFMSRAIDDNMDDDEDLTGNIEVNSLQLTSNLNWAQEQAKDPELGLGDRLN